MNFSSSKAADKPSARTRSSQQPIDVLGPHPIPTWPAYYRHHLAPNPPPPRPDVVASLSSNSAATPLPVPTAAINRLVKLWQGDITKLRVGAVVNAANSGMWAGGGICGAIHSAAGSELEAECERWVSANGKVPTGQTLATRAFRLPADFVFHTVGPTDGSWEKLSSCYRSCLELLLQHQCRSIAFCCVSTGIFGFPNLEAAICALQTVRQWLDEDERHRQAVDCILFCVFLDKDKDIYERHMPLFFPLTRDEVEGKANDETAEPANGGADGRAAVEKGGDLKAGGSDGKTEDGEQPGGQQSGDVMEVSRGDTVWVRADNHSPADPSTQQTNDASAEADQPQSAQEEEEHRKRMTASILARNIQFSRAPPPSSDAPHPHSNRRACVLFFSSTSALTPHVAALLTNSQHGEHIEALWTTSHKDGPLVDEIAAGAMQEMDLDESDDPITQYSAVAAMVASGRIDCVVAVDGVAQQQAQQLFGERVPLVHHEVADPQAAVGGGEADLAHQQVRYRQSFNEVKAFVDDLPSVLEQRL